MTFTRVKRLCGDFLEGYGDSVGRAHKATVFMKVPLDICLAVFIGVGVVITSPVHILAAIVGLFVED